MRIHEKTLPDFFQIFKLISSGCTSALKWTQLTLNGLYKKKTPVFKIFKWNLFHSIVLIKTINLSYCWARLDKNWDSNAPLKKCRFSRFGPKIDILQFQEKFMNFFVKPLDSNVEKLEKNYGEFFFDLALTVFCWFAINCF